MPRRPILHSPDEIRNFAIKIVALGTRRNDGGRRPTVTGSECQISKFEEFDSVSGVAGDWQLANCPNASRAFRQVIAIAKN